MELSQKYLIVLQPPINGLFQANLHKKTKVEEGTKLGEPLYSSGRYPSKEQAYQDVENHYKNNYSK
ncbi:hypothetical protein [Neobacillus cucumis]|uniref:hypothetical protein n=1 Tax=Neobacillus cucumis TaxID=1740721 RepID=UPI002E21E232|nr:hypothetical protein [Neobacillus cucumis]